jgi:hypothetical protein
MIALVPQTAQRHRSANGLAALGPQSQLVSGCFGMVFSFPVQTWVAAASRGNLPVRRVIERKKAMTKAYKHQRRQRTQRRLKNQSFMEPSKRPLTGKRKKSFIRSLLASP